MGRVRETIRLVKGCRFFQLSVHDGADATTPCGKRSAHALDCVLSKIDGHLDRMHSYDKNVQGDKSRIRLGTLSKTLIPLLWTADLSS